MTWEESVISGLGLFGPASSRDTVLSIPSVIARRRFSRLSLILTEAPILAISISWTYRALTMNCWWTYRGSR